MKKKRKDQISVFDNEKSSTILYHNIYMVMVQLYENSVNTIYRNSSLLVDNFLHILYKFNFMVIVIHIEYVNSNNLAYVSAEVYERVTIQFSDIKVSMKNSPWVFQIVYKTSWNVDGYLLPMSISQTMNCREL